MIPRVSGLLPSLRARVLVGTVLVVCATALVVGGVITLAARTWIYQDAQDRALDEFRTQVEASSPLGEWPPEFVVVRGGAPVSDRIGLAGIPASIREATAAAGPGQYRFERLPGGWVAMGYHDIRPSPAPDIRPSPAPDIRPSPAPDIRPNQAPGSRSAPPTLIFTVAPLGDVQDRLDHLTTIMVLSVGGAAIVGVGFGVVVARTAVRPLRAVQATATSIAAGDHEARMSPAGISELRGLSATFNDMLDKQEESLAVLREQEQRSRRFVADVSHELRSPLAALVPAAEVLDEELADDPGVRGRAARLLSSEVTALSDLVEDLLEMTRRDAGLAEVAAETVDVVRVLREAADQRGWRDVPVHAPHPVTATTDPRRLIAVVTNLIGNALRHGAPPVTVEVRRTAGRGSPITVTVTDAGAGVDAAHLPRVFDRMYKASDARTRTGGAGLGLAIARENARLLGGDVVYRRIDGATAFVAEFADRTDPTASD